LDLSAIQNIRNTNKEISLVCSYKLATTIGGILLNWRKEGFVLSEDKEER